MNTNLQDTGDWQHFDLKKGAHEKQILLFDHFPLKGIAVWDGLIKPIYSVDIKI
jgi:hypothetical protein